MDQSTARLEGTYCSCLHLILSAEWSRLDKGAALWCLSLAPGTKKMFADPQGSVLPPQPIPWLGIRALGLVSSLHLPLSCVSLSRVNATASAASCPSRTSWSFWGYSQVFIPHLIWPKVFFCFCCILLLCNITASSWVWCWMEKSLLQ